MPEHFWQRGLLWLDFPGMISLTQTHSRPAWEWKVQDTHSPLFYWNMTYGRQKSRAQSCLNSSFMKKAVFLPLRPCSDPLLSSLCIVICWQIHEVLKLYQLPLLESGFVNNSYSCFGRNQASVSLCIQCYVGTILLMILYNKILQSKVKIKQ